MMHENRKKCAESIAEILKSDNDVKVFILYFSSSGVAGSFTHGIDVPAQVGLLTMQANKIAREFYKGESE